MEWIKIKRDEGDVEVSVWEIAKSLTPEQFAELIDNYLNLGGKSFPEGLATGKRLRSTHRTLQRLVIVHCFGIIAGLSEQEHTDPRNEVAIKTAKKVAKMIADGELPFGLYI